MNKSIFSNLKYDIPSGLLVFLVALPLCLGIALASGAPLFAGIITGIIGGIVVGSLSGSSVSVSGPAAGLTIIVLTAIENLGSYEVFLVAVLLAGVIQLIMGFIKAGIVSHYFPSSVIKGMLAAIGLILILQQIPHAIGWSGNFAEMGMTKDQDVIGSFLAALDFFHGGAIIIALVSLSIMLLWEQPKFKKLQFFKIIPGGLIAVTAGIFINLIYQYFAPGMSLKGDYMVKLPVASNPAEFAGQFTLPDFSALSNPEVYMVAVTIAIVASIETLLNIEATDKLDPYKRITPTNRELKAQGIGNVISGLVGGLPMTSVIVRSSANIQSGARSKMSAVIHGMLLLVSVVSLPHVLNLIPLASLAAILLVIGYKLARVSLFKQMYSLGYSQFIPFVVTIGAILLTDLLTGIIIGMSVSVFFILRNNYKSPYHFESETNGKGKTIRINLAEEVTFINKGSVLLTLRGIPKNSDVIIDGSRSKNIDYDVKELLNNFQETAKHKNINLTLNNIK